jgi:hypothetical protein
MVVTAFPETFETGVLQERCAWPSTWTVHAPHNPIPQPNLVPVKPSVSRRTQSNGIWGTTSTFCRCPLTVKLIAAIQTSSGRLEPL